MKLPRGLVLAHLLVALGAITLACDRTSPANSSAQPAPPSSRRAPAGQSATDTGAEATPTVTATAPAAATTTELDTTPYPWHADRSLDVLPAVDHLEARFSAPPGFARIALAPESFGAWLRRLPLAAPDEPVRSYRGAVLLRAGHPHVAAVTTLDIGKADLQQCADAVMRLHAEWAWSRGRRDMTYRAAAGTALPYARWARGERVVLRGRSLAWESSGRANSDHPSFRRYLDAVFSWANTVSLERQADAVELEALRPGDFFILPGNPGHAVLVLDLAQSSDGRRAVLLGQSYMPAQSFQVLRPSPESPWFAVDPEQTGIQTPFWPAPFVWSSLRRLD